MAYSIPRLTTTVLLSALLQTTNAVRLPFPAGFSPDPDQQPLAADPSDVGFAHLPLTAIGDVDVVYTVVVGVGTPPQSLHLKLDISSPDSYVPDVSLPERGRCRSGNFFNKDLSSTFYTQNERRDANFTYDRIYTSGILASDVLRLGPVEIPRQGFLDADHQYVNGISFDDYCGVDGVLGLSNSSASSALGVPGLLPNLIDRGNMDAGLFAVRLREPAELSLGAINERAYRGTLARLPLIPREGSEYSPNKSDWRTRINGIMAGSEPALHYVLGQTVTLSTASVFMYIPVMVYLDLIMGALGFQDRFMLPPSIDCAERSVLPDITFNLAGHNFTITPWDYTRVLHVPGGETRCISVIMPIGSETEDHPEVILGTAFLQAFYSVFDVEKQTIGLASLS